MADKQEGGGECTAETSSLRAEIISLAATRLKEVFKKSKEGEVSKVLARRKRKWRKRYKSDLPSGPHSLDSALREEKEMLLDTRIELMDALVKRRRVCLGCARQLQREGDTSTLQVISGRLDYVRRSLQDYRESHTAATTQLASLPTNSGAAEERVLQDLESTLSQAAALTKIQGMKHHMTPRMPPIHRRPLITDPLNDTHSTSLLVDKLQITSVRSCADSSAQEETQTNTERDVPPQHGRGTSVGDCDKTLQTDGKFLSGCTPHSVESRSAQNDELCTMEGGDKKHHHHHTYSEDSTELLEDDQIPVAQTVESTMVELTPEDLLHHSRRTAAKSLQKKLETAKKSSTEDELKRVAGDEERDTGTSSHDEEQEIVANSTAQSESDTEQDQEIENIFRKIATMNAPKSLSSRGRGRKKKRSSHRK